MYLILRNLLKMPDKSIPTSNASFSKQLRFIHQRKGSYQTQKASKINDFEGLLHFREPDWFGIF